MTWIMMCRLMWYDSSWCAFVCNGINYLDEQASVMIWVIMIELIRLTLFSSHSLGKSCEKQKDIWPISQPVLHQRQQMWSYWWWKAYWSQGEFTYFPLFLYFDMRRLVAFVWFVVCMLCNPYFHVLLHDCKVKCIKNKNLKSDFLCILNYKFMHYCLLNINIIYCWIKHFSI